MQRLLIVEGEEDQKFFEYVLALLEINARVTHVKVESQRGKDKAITTFRDALSGLLTSAKAQIGLMVDADDFHVNQDSGFQKTQSKINQVLQGENFNALNVIPNSTGYKSLRNGFKDVKAGVWIMPNNKDDGYLEHFSIKIISESEEAQFKFAHDQTKKIMDKVHQGPDFSFKDHHFEKAAIGAWLAWSDPPRMGLGLALKEKKRLDINHVEFDHLKAWLHWLYGSTTA